MQGRDHYCGAPAAATINVMNTSAITNQTHTTGTTGFLRRTITGGLLATAIAATAVGLAATSHADQDFGAPAHAGAICKTESWGFLGSQRRTLCDGPISADGSWSRERTIWAPAHQTPRSCTYSTDRSYSGTSNCSGGYFIPERLISNETYPVRPETVLHDEPGHLG
jgi:hypothetical protein